ncbi:hypothetical protein CLAIMM_07537 [Cladophialophora immunda]|nr:hypothetical protein CLAIMM_07537 [Cladophialophora immunda]
MGRSNNSTSIFPSQEALGEATAVGDEKLESPELHLDQEMPVNNYALNAAPEYRVRTDAGTLLFWAMV